MAKKFAFAKGIATGVVATAATVAGAIFAVKKKIIEPEEEKAAFIQENRKKAALSLLLIAFLCVFLQNLPIFNTKFIQ